MSPNSSSAAESLVSSAPLAGERVTFTGVLASMTHGQASNLVREQGGEAVDRVSRQVTMLVVGEEGWPLEDDGRPSIKLQQALDWQARGVELRIVNESDFLRMLGPAEGGEEARRLHTPAMLSQLLDVPVHVIRGWERAGLVRAVKRVHRLPYFDFQEVSSARRLSELLQAGVPRDEIERSLKSLPGVVSGERRPFEQLEVLARDRKIVLRDQHGLRAPDGQRLMSFDGEEAPSPAAEEDDAEPLTSISFLDARQQALEMERRDWLVEGCRHADEGELAAAIEAFRMALMFEPQNPEVHFQLGDALYRKGRVHAALERFYAAAELDHDYVEAWTQIGALHRELGEPESARDAFAVALDIHEDSPEAQFQMAETLAELGRPHEAVPHWEAYLEFEQRGPWAELARRRVSGLAEERPAPAE